MTTVTIDAHRRQMLELLNRGRTYEFLTLAGPYLALRRDDAYVGLMAVREYLALGLVEPAREVFQLVEQFASLSKGYEDIRDALSQIAPAGLAWDLHAGTFDVNLRALAERGFDADALRTAWVQEKHRFQLFTDRNGHFQLRRHDQQHGWRWFPALRDHDAAERTQPLPEDVGNHTPGPYLFEGLGSGGYFQRVYEATRDTFLGFACALFVVEPDAAGFCAQLHLRDLQIVLADERVFPIIGKTWPQQLRQSLEANVNVPLPNRIITSGVAFYRQTPKPADVVHEVAATRQQQLQRSWEELQAMYATRNIGWWAGRFDEALAGKGPPLRILAAVSIHTTFLQHSMRDARRAFQSLGHECTVLSEGACYEVISPLTFHRAVRELKPDLFLALDHIRPEFRGVIPDGLPILTWDQDQLPHVFTKANIDRIAPHDFLAGCSKALLVSMGLPSQQMLHARMPTCPEQFGGEALTDEEYARYQCDVSFVSHASQTPQQFHEEERRNYTDPRLQRLLDVMYERTPHHLGRYQTPHGGAIRSILTEAMRTCGITDLPDELRNRLLYWYLWRLGDRRFRHEALEWTAQWARHNKRSFRLYGNGWERHPTLSEFAAGPAANGRELLCVYRASRINLQLMPAGFLHQRALDGLAAGGFFLTRATPLDANGRFLHELFRHVRTRDLNAVQDCLASDDDAVRRAVRVVIGEGIYDDASPLSFRDWLGIAGEIAYPDEILPEFHRIVFDSADSLARAADAFLHNEQERRRLAEAMREAVTREFSYRAAMHRFLAAMRDYLIGRCMAKGGAKTAEPPNAPAQPV